MTWYIITWEDKEHRDQNLSSGFVLGVVDVMNPEEAMVEIANRVLEDDIKDEMSAAGKVGLAQWILEHTNEEEENHEVRVYQLAVTETGNPVSHMMDDLEFEGPEPSVNPPDHVTE